MQIVYSSKDLTSYPSQINSPQESVTLTSKLGKLKSLGCSVQHKYRRLQQASWTEQSDCVSGYTVTVALEQRKGSKKLLAFKMPLNIHIVQKTHIFSSSSFKKITFPSSLFFIDNIYNLLILFSLQWFEWAKKKNLNPKVSSSEKSISWFNYIILNLALLHKC